MTVALHILDAGGHFGARRAAVAAGAEAGRAYVASRVALPAVDVAIYPTDFGRDATIAAHASGPNTVAMGIDVAFCDRPDLGEQVRCCLIHELNHCARWPHVARWTVAECAVLEGLAKRADIAAHRDSHPDAPEPGWAIADPDRLDAELRARAETDMEDARDWLYGAEPGTPPGTPPRIHTAGLRVVTAALARLDRDPWTALPLPATAILAAAFDRERDQT